MKKKEQLKFDKDSIILIGKYNSKKDLLNVLLDNKTQYSLLEVEEKINEFMKGGKKLWH